MEEKEIEFKQESDPDNCQDILRVYSFVDYIVLEIGGYSSDTREYSSGNIILSQKQVEELVVFLQQLNKSKLK